MNELTQDSIILLMSEIERQQSAHPSNVHLGEAVYARMRDAAGFELRRDRAAIRVDREIPRGGEHWIVAAAACMRLYMEGATNVSPSMVSFFACMGRPASETDSMEVKREGKLK